jgi:hypothetical protein
MNKKLLKTNLFMPETVLFDLLTGFSSESESTGFPTPKHQHRFTVYSILYYTIINIKQKLIPNSQKMFSSPTHLPVENVLKNVLFC